MLGAVAMSAAAPLLFASRLQANAADSPTLRVGDVPIEPGADIYYAQEQGYLKAAGLNVDIEVLANGQNFVGAVAAGSYDIATSTIPAIAVARERGILIKLISPGGVHLSSAPTDLLLVPQNSPLRTARDLNGKTIAVSGLNNLPAVAVRAWISKNGGDASSIKLVEFAFPAMAEALQLGRMDAAVITEPFITAAAGLRPLGSPYDAIAPRFIINGWFAADAWLEKNGLVARRFAEALRKTHEWANGHAKESTATLVSMTKIAPQLAATMTRTVFATSLSEQSIQPVLDIAASSGMLPRPMAAAELIWQLPT
jgi:NitT/TauT family transport system substrate-binding protein